MGERHIDSVREIARLINNGPDSGCPNFMSDIVDGERFDLCIADDPDCPCYDCVHRSSDNEDETVGLCRLHTIGTEIGDITLDLRRGKPRRLTIN